MLKKGKTGVKKIRALDKSSVCEYVVGRRILPSAVARLEPHRLVSVDPAIVCERIQIVRYSGVKRVSQTFREVEGVMYPIASRAVVVGGSEVRVIDSANVVMRVSVVKSFFGRIDDLPRASFKSCKCHKSL